MSDDSEKRLRFHVTGLLNGARYRAQRYALSSLITTTDTDGASGGYNRRFVAGVPALLELWRTRLWLLRNRGWNNTEGSNWLFTLNCPPAGVLTWPCRTYTCRQARICPFCWARDYVGYIYDRIERYLFYAAPPGTSEPVNIADIITLVDTYRWPIELSPADIAIKISVLRESYAASLRAGLGGSLLWSVEPSDVRKSLSEHWVVKARMLKLIPGNDRFTLPSDFDLERVVSREFGVGRRALVAAVGRTLRYPRQLMFGPPGPIVTWLNSLHVKGSSGRSKPVRLLSLYGVLRGGRN